MCRSHAILVAGLGLAVLLLAAQAAGNSARDKPTARSASVLIEPHIPGVLAAGPQIELTLYMVSADDGTPDSSTPGTERVSFHPGETVRVTLCASNTGSGAEITAVCSLRDHAQTGIEYVCYDSHDPRKTPSGAVEDSTQYVPSDGAKYFSFDYVLPKWAPSGAYDVAGAARNPADWDELWDTTAPGPADENWGNAWLNGEFSVTPVHAVSVPILMYHEIEASLGSPSCVTPETFDKQMAALAAYGYTCVTVDEIMSYRAGTSSPPANPVLLTFDDGYRNHLTNALPVLQDHGLSGTFFIITGVTEESMVAGKDKLIWPEVQTLKSAGMEIGSHTVTHPRLTSVGDARLEAEVRDSMADIEAHLGMGTCTAFAYPFGDGHDDQRVEAAVRDARYHGALAAKGGIDNTASCNPFALKRMAIREEHSVDLDNESPDHFFMKKVDPNFPIPDIVVDSISFEDTNGTARSSFAPQETVVIKVSARNLGDPVDAIGSLEIDNDLDPGTPSEYDSHIGGGDVLVTAFGSASRMFEYSWTIPPHSPMEQYYCVFGVHDINYVLGFEHTAWQAAFEVVESHTLTVCSAPVTGITISGVPGGTTDYAVSLADGFPVSLSAPLLHPHGRQGYRFLRWTLNGAPQAGDPLAFKINDDTLVVAQYTVVAEHGVALVDHNWTKVNLTETFSDPVVVAGPATSIGWQPGVVRLRNVTASSFEVRFQEWDYLDGWHTPEKVPWVAVDRGVHELGRGQKLVAEKFDTATWNVLAPEWVAFPEAFDAAPVVLAQVQTFNGAEAVTDRICSVQADGMFFSMQEQEAGSWHCAETVGYVALQEGVQDIASIPCEVRRMAAVVTHKPSILVGSEGQCLVRVEEEQSADSETRHPAAEAVGFLSLAGEPPLVADMQTRNGPDPCALRARVLAQSFQAEEGIAEIDHQWSRVSFGGTYRNPVVLAGPASYAGADPGVVRVRGVTPTSFELRFQEWDYLDGWHCREKVHWMVAERGVWDAGGGRLWILDESPLSNMNALAPTQVNLPLPLMGVDIVLATQQTAVGAAAVTERLSAIGPTGFRVSLQEEAAADAWHVEENLGYLVIGTGAGGLAALAPEVTVGTGDPAGWQLSVVEEQSKDQETWHAAEQVDYAAFGGYADGELHFLAAMQSYNGIDPCSLRARRLEAACVVVAARDEEGNVLAGVPVAVSGALGPAGVIATELRPVQCAQEPGRTLTLTALPSLFDGGRAFAFSHWEVDGQPAELGRTTVELDVPQAGRAVAIYVAVQ